MWAAGRQRIGWKYKFRVSEKLWSEEAHVHFTHVASGGIFPLVTHTHALNSMCTAVNRGMRNQHAPELRRRSERGEEGERTNER